jgi:Ca2+/Na+ antiporter
MSSKQSKLRVMLSEVFQANGLLITIFTCVAIVFGGFTLIESPERWWVAVVLVGAVFAAIFLLINATIVIKVLLSLAVLLLTAAFAFQGGATLDPNDSGAFIWLFGTFVVYFGSLAISYLISSGQSRWSILILTEFAYFVGVFVLTMLGLSLTWTAAAGILTAFVFFGLVYRFGSRSRTAEDDMPQNVVSEVLDYSLPRAAAFAGLKTRRLADGDKKAFIVWSDRAYLIYPVKLEQALGSIGRKKVQLSYKGKSVNPWLRHLNFTLIPHRKSRGADIMLVLADTSNANGTEAKTIGVSVPDSKAVVPVGIIPGKLLLSRDEPALKKALMQLEPNFADFTDALSEKQKQALEDFGDAKDIVEDEAK